LPQELTTLVEGGPIAVNALLRRLESRIWTLAKRYSGEDRQETRNNCQLQVH
jgi:hypothetical protein